MRKAFTLDDNEIHLVDDHADHADDVDGDKDGDAGVDTASKLPMNTWQVDAAEVEEETELQNFIATNGLTRNACLAHLLQLAIKDSAKSSLIVMGLAKKLTEVITFFNRSSHHYTKLKERAGYSLVKPCATRWNSLYHGFQRLQQITKTNKVVFVITTSTS